MAKFNIKNPNTNRVWKLQELHDAYSDKQLQVISLQGRVSELETKVDLKYNWPTICKAAQSLASERAKADTKKITRSIYRELSLELINYPRK